MNKTYVVKIFKELAKKQKIDMIPRSKFDKEFFSQDWFADRLKDLSLNYDLQGRNSYPDFWVLEKDQLLEGFEIKSLELCDNLRKTVDFNSTVPSGKRAGKNMFLVFFLYSKEDNYRKVHTINISHMDFINSNCQWQHSNNSISGFGSYGDGFIRNRKMYLFPHPISLYPQGLGKCQLILPKEWDVLGLKKIDTICRNVLKQTIHKYTIDMEDQSSIEVTYKVKKKKKKTLEFNVFEVK